MDKNQIILDSKQIITKKESVSSINTSLSDYEDNIQYMFEDDNLNRCVFLNNASILSGLTLEFRNIYGIEAPYYEIDDCSIAIDKNGDGNISSSEYINFNGSKTFKDNPQIINAARFDAGIVNGTRPLDNQRYFVDSMKDRQDSIFPVPWCPPGLDKWAGNHLYEYICKNFDFTELTLYKFLSQNKPTLTEESCELYPNTDSIYKPIQTLETWHKFFDSENPVSYNVDKNGKLTKNTYVYNVSDDQLISDFKNEKITYSIKAGSSDTNPIVYYKHPNKFIATSVLGLDGKYHHTYKFKKNVYTNLHPEQTVFINGELPEYDIEEKTYDDPWANSDSILVKYELYTYEEQAITTVEEPVAEGEEGEETLTTTLIKNKFCDGVCALSVKTFPREGDTDLTGQEFDREFCVNIISQNGELKKESDIYIDPDTSWLYDRIGLYASYNKNPYYITMFPITAADDVKECNASLVKFYRNMLNDVCKYYNIFIDTGRSSKIDIKQSLALMNDVVNKINTYLETQQDITPVINSISERLKYIYDVGDLEDIDITEAPVRASEIHSFMTKNESMYLDIYTSIVNRIDKRIGTLRNMFTIVNNSNIAAQSMTVKKRNVKGLYKDMAVFTIADGLGTNKLMVQLEPWENTSIGYSNLYRMADVYVVCDNEDIFLKTVINDVDIVIDGDTTYFQITLKDETSLDAEEYSPRVVVLMN